MSEGGTLPAGGSPAPKRKLQCEPSRFGMRAVPTPGVTCVEGGLGWERAAGLLQEVPVRGRVGVDLGRVAGGSGARFLLRGPSVA